MQNKIIGNYGEKIASDYIRKKGYKIIDKNLKISYKELDIIAKHKGKLIFIEVKTRTSDFLGKAEDSMSAKKLHHLKKAINMYTSSNKSINPEMVRLDLICIDIDKVKKTAKIKHYKDIF